MAGRIALMRRMLGVFETMKDEIVALEALELGAPVSFSAFSHCGRQYGRIRVFLEAAESLRLEEKGGRSTVLREPLGVVACITPWNYPLGQIVQKVVPALLMGNTVVLKPSSHTPLTAALFVEAFRLAGFPPGVINLIQGSGRVIGEILSTHPEVDMVSFTGSTKVGSGIAARAAATVKKVSLELGGKSACIWLKSPDYRGGLPKLVSSIFMNSGQTCTSLSRLLVPGEDLGRIEPMLVEAASSLRMGDPADPRTDIGPLAFRAHYENVKRYIALGAEEGARLLCGGGARGLEKGFFVEPTVFSDVSPQMRIAREEIFGPVLCVIPYGTVDEAVNIANDSVYGLSGAVFGEREAALAVARRLKTGNVYVNSAGRDETAPFGGWRQSGHGREGGLSGLVEFSQTKTILDNLG